MIDDFNSGNAADRNITQTGGNLSSEVAPIGTGGCSLFSGGSGGALCFNGDSTGGADSITLVYEDVVFDQNEQLSFTIASAATAAFEPADFVQISAEFDTMAPPGNDQFVEIANLIGVANTQTFIPDPSGSGLASFGPTSPTFQTISLPVTEILNNAGITSTSFMGDLTFVVSISTQNEFFAFDNIQTSVVPVPPAIALMLGGIGLLAWRARRGARSQRSE
ncbi:MAG: hypothetical protein AAFP17_19350 [Pseudomonadota bacterium]